jgi:hypothetical protein
MSTDVIDLINALRDGTMTLEQVAERFRHRSWPRRRLPPSTYLENAAAAEEDPEPYMANSFDDVLAAYDAGNITDEQYAVLSEAVAESERDEDRRNSVRGQDTDGE